MASDAWNPSGTTLRMSATGTLVGMPAVKGRELDPFQPQRWSHPPANDLAPIVPCAEPDDESELVSPWRALAVQESTPLPILPRRRVMPEAERRLLEQAAIVGTVLVCIIVALVALAARFAH